VAAPVEGEVSFDSLDVDAGEASLAGFLELVKRGVCAVHISEVMFVVV
jgi:hypothetical protein